MVAPGQGNLGNLKNIWLWQPCTSQTFIQQSKLTVNDYLSNAKKIFESYFKFSCHDEEARQRKKWLLPSWLEKKFIYFITWKGKYPVKKIKKIEKLMKNERGVYPSVVILKFHATFTSGIVLILKRFVDYLLIFISVSNLMYYKCAINFPTKLKYHSQHENFPTSIKDHCFAFLFSILSVIIQFSEIYWAYLSLHYHFKWRVKFDILHPIRRLVAPKLIIAMLLMLLIDRGFSF